MPQKKKDKSPIGAIIPGHPLWDDFCYRLGAEEGINIHHDPDGRFRYSCPCDRRKPMAMALLKKMGLSDEEIADSFEFYEAHGGCCDCEIVFNVEGAAR